MKCDMTIRDLLNTVDEKTAIYFKGDTPEGRNPYYSNKTKVPDYFLAYDVYRYVINTDSRGKNRIHISPDSTSLPDSFNNGWVRYDGSNYQGIGTYKNTIIYAKPLMATCSDEYYAFCQLRNDNGNIQISFIDCLSKNDYVREPYSEMIKDSWPSGEHTGWVGTGLLVKYMYENDMVDHVVTASTYQEAIRMLQEITLPVSDISKTIMFKVHDRVLAQVCDEFRLARPNYRAAFEEAFNLVREIGTYFDRDYCLLDKRLRWGAVESIPTALSTHKALEGSYLKVLEYLVHHATDSNAPLVNQRGDMLYLEGLVECIHSEKLSFRTSKYGIEVYKSDSGARNIAVCTSDPEKLCLK